MMVTLRIGDEFPAAGRHATHDARIAAVDLHGIPSWDEPRAGEPVPTVTVVCSCGAEWAEHLAELAAA